MLDMLGHPTVRAILFVSVVLIASYVGIQVIFALRPNTSKDDTNPTDLASEFEEMRSGGDINAEELRNIKAVLGRNQHRS